jgi:hypothetical protein
MTNHKTANFKHRRAAKHSDFLGYHLSGSYFHCPKEWKHQLSCFTLHTVEKLIGSRTQYSFEQILFFGSYWIVFSLLIFERSSTKVLSMLIEFFQFIHYKMNSNLTQKWLILSFTLEWIVKIRQWIKLYDFISSTRISEWLIHDSWVPYTIQVNFVFLQNEKLDRD